MNIVLSIVKAIVAWFVLMFIGSNIIGFIVRGLVEMPVTKRLEVDMSTALRKEVTAYRRFSRIITLFSVVIGIVYICALYWVWNIGAAAAALLLMVIRIPDLLREIRTGEKVRFGSMPRGFFDTVLAVLMWATLPLLWFSMR